MRSAKRITRWLMTGVAVFGIGRSVEAGIITVDNAGFDKIPLASSGYTYTLDNWVAGAESPWISNGYYSNQPTPVTEALVSQTGDVYQELGDTFQESMTYIFSIEGGVSDVGSENYRLYIFDATASDYMTPLAVDSGALPVDGVFHPLSVQYVATAAEAGNTIGIGVAGIDGGYYCYYDNAEMTVIPEPATLLLLGAGALLLPLRRRRR